MKLRPKLEFIRFTLNCGDGVFKTFRDFAIEVLNVKKTATDAQLMNRMLDYFTGTLATEKAKDNSIKKQLKLIRSKTNKYHAHIPKASVKDNVISGVISGGRFGRHGLMSDSKVDVEDAKTIDKNNTILRYYYFFLYVPLDHNEGFLCIHSNSKEETVTELMRTFVSKLFSGLNGYRRPLTHPFCPKLVREEFKQEAILSELVFRDTILDNIFHSDGLQGKDEPFEIEIKIRPKGESRAGVTKVMLQRVMTRLRITRPNGSDSLSDFRTKKATVKNLNSSSNRSFDINKESIDSIVPVVYLDDKIKVFNDDDTPDFAELDTFCYKLFREQIIPELRPDLV